MTLTTFLSGIVCIGAAAFMMYILYLDYNNKRHILRIFQLGLSAILMILGILQVCTALLVWVVGMVPSYYQVLYNIVFTLFAVLLIPYFRYQKRKQRIHSQQF